MSSLGATVPTRIKAFGADRLVEVSDQWDPQRCWPHSRTKLCKTVGAGAYAEGVIACPDKLVSAFDSVLRNSLVRYCAVYHFAVSGPFESGKTKGPNR